jgi:lipopolysaccharide transport system permease protein
MVTGFGVSLWLSSLNVLYRDVGYVTPFIAQLWLFITPIAYGSTLVPEQWRFMYALNPMVGVVNGFRWALLNTQDNAPGPILWISVLVALAILISGLFYFRRMERQFADMV